MNKFSILTFNIILKGVYHMDTYIGMFWWLILLVIIASIFMAIYSRKNHYKLKEQKLELEKEKLNLERKKLEIEEKKLNN